MPCIRLGPCRPQNIGAWWRPARVELLLVMGPSDLLGLRCGEDADAIRPWH